MADKREFAVVAGGIVGGYLSDATDNPFGGILSIGIGAAVGKALQLPTAQVINNPTQVNLGPKVEETLLDRAAQKFEKSKLDPGNLAAFDRIANRFEAAVKKVNRIEDKATADIIASDLRFDDRIDHIGNSLIKSEKSINDKYDQSILRQDERFDDGINKFSKYLVSVMDQEQLNRHNSRLFRKQQNFTRFTSGGSILTDYMKHVANGGVKVDKNESIATQTSNFISQSDKEYKESKKFKNFIKFMDTEISKPNKTALKQAPIEEQVKILLKEYRNKNPKQFSALQASENTKDIIFKAYTKDESAAEREIIRKQVEAKTGYDLNLYTRAKESIEVARKAELDQLKNGTKTEDLENLKGIKEDQRQIILDAKKERLDKVLAWGEPHEDKINAVRDAIQNAGGDVGNGSVADLRKAVENSEDKDVNNLIRSLLKNKDSKVVDIQKSSANAIQSQHSSVNATDTKALATWFRDKLGNTPEDADMKAAMFTNRAAEGSMITMKDGKVSVVDKVSGNILNVPVTSYDGDGNRFHYAGRGNYNTVTQQNPLGLLYIEGKEMGAGDNRRAVTAADVLKGYDPEMMLSYLPEDRAADDIIPRIKSLFHYDSQEAGRSSVHLGSDFKADSPMYKQSQGMVNLGMGFNADARGKISEETPLRPVGISANREGEASERIKLLTNLSADTNIGTLSDGVSMNALTTVNTKGVEGFVHNAPAERNPTGVGNRGTTIVNPTQDTLDFKANIGEEVFNTHNSSSQVFKKIDVKDSELFNELTTNMFGNDNVLYDGASLFNRGKMDDFTIEDRTPIKINKEAHVISMNDEFTQALSDSDMNQYLKNNPIHVGKDPIAMVDGNMVGIDRRHSNGIIDGAYQSADSLYLSMRSQFSPIDENSSKLFSLGNKTLASGLEEGRFMLNQNLAEAINSGEITRELDVNGVQTGKYNHSYTDAQGTVVNNTLEGDNDLLMALNERNKRVQPEPVHYISDAGDTGMSKVMGAIKDGVAGDVTYDHLVANNIDRETAGFTSMLFRENKAAVDLATTVSLGIGRQATQDLLSQEKYQALDKAGRQDVELQLAKEISKTDIVDNYKKGYSRTIGSLNEGRSKVGVGNRAGMSWVAMSNLLQSGVSREDLKAFGRENEEMLYEVKSQLEERRLSKKSINTAIEGRESDFLASMNSAVDPSERFSLLEQYYNKNELGAVKENPFITYNLHTQDKDIKAINFARINTTRSGYFQGSDGISMLKELDKHKISIVEADLQLKYSVGSKEKKEAQAQVNKALTSYKSLIKTIYSGDNNLAKSALSLVSDTSAIMEIKAVGGDADEFFKRGLKGVSADGTVHDGRTENRWFLTTDAAEHKARQAGFELQFEDTEAKTIKQPMVRKLGSTDEFLPLTSMVTREPAQGPLSSDLVHWYVDSTLNNSQHNRNTSFVSLSNTLYKLGTSGDGDQDTVQALTSIFKDKDQYNRVEDGRATIRDIFKETEPLIQQMSNKSGGKGDVVKNVSEMDKAERADYNLAGSLKGRNRKTLAAKATAVAVNMSKALELAADKSNAESEKLLVQSRMVVYQLVENLIKSAHIDTDKFLGITQQAVEKISQSRARYIGSGTDSRITEKEFRSVLKKELPTFLNLDPILKGNDLKQKALAEKLIGHLIDSEATKAPSLRNTTMSPLDLGRTLHGGDTSDFLHSIAEMISSSQIAESEVGEFGEFVGQATKQVGKAVKDNLSEIFRTNKKLIFGGLAGMGAVALMTRGQPDFEKPQREYSANTMRQPQPRGVSHAPSAMGIETNPNRTAHITPKSFNGKNVRAQTEQIQEDTFTSLLDYDPVDNAQSVASALFNKGIRSAKIINS